MNKKSTKKNESTKDVIHSISATIKNSDATKVEIKYTGESMPNVDDFSCMIMGLLDSYIAGLLVKNSRPDVYKHFNSLFGKCLSRICSPSEIYELDKSHKEFKEHVDKTLGRAESKFDKEDTDNVRFAAVLLAGDILVNECGMTEQSANMLLSRHLNMVKPITDEELKAASKKFEKSLAKKDEEKK